MKSEYQILCATVKKRERLAREMTHIAERHGANVTRQELGDREVSLTLHKGAFHCNIDFDGAIKLDAFLGHWWSDGREYPHDFGDAIRGSMNTYHWRKATSCCENWTRFCASIVAGLTRLDTWG